MDAHEMGSRKEMASCGWSCCNFSNVCGFFTPAQAQPYPSSNRCVARTGCSVFIVSIILSTKIPIHKNISVFQLIISWHTLPAGQNASTNTVREQIRAKTGEFLA